MNFSETNENLSNICVEEEEHTKEDTLDDAVDADDISDNPLGTGVYIIESYVVVSHDFSRSHMRCLQLIFERFCTRVVSCTLS